MALPEDQEGQQLIAEEETLAYNQDQALTDLRNAAGFSGETPWGDLSLQQPSSALYDDYREERSTNFNQMGVRRRVVEDRLIQAADMEQKAAAEGNPTGLELLTASFMLDNSVSSFLYSPLKSKVAYRPDGIDPFGIDPETGERYLQGYEMQAAMFTDVVSKQHLDDMKAQIRMEQANRETMQAGGWVSTVTGMTAVGLDPTTLASLLVPIAQQGAGARIASSVGIGAVTASTQEALLQSTQVLRTPNESLYNVLAGTILDSALGTAAQTMRLSHRTMGEAYLSGLQKQIGKEMVGDTPMQSVSDSPLMKEASPDVSENADDWIDEPRSASAAESGIETITERQATGEKLKRASKEFAWTGLEATALLMARATPTGRLMQSKNPQVRAVTQGLIETSLETGGSGYIPLSVETAIKNTAKRTDGAISVVRTLEKKSGLDANAFGARLDEALRNNDFSDIPAVQEAAQTLRKHVISPIWDAAAEAKVPGTFREVFDKETGLYKTEKVESTTSDSYWRRQYDVDMVRQNKSEFKKRWKAAIEDAHMRDMQAYRTELKSLGDDVAEDVRAKLEESKPSPLPEDELAWDDKLEDIFKNTVNAKVGTMQAQIGTSATMTKQRAQVLDSFFTGNEEAGQIGFLVNDWESLINGYRSQLSPKTEMARAFDGDPDLSIRLEEITDEYGDRAEAARKAGDEKKAKKFERQLAANTRDIEAVRDLITGNYQPVGASRPENRWALGMFRGLRSINASRMLGSVVVASVPEMSRILAYDGLQPYTASMAKMAKKGNVMKSLKAMDDADIQDFILSSELLSMGRINQLTDADVGMNPITQFDRVTSKINDFSMTASGMKHYNAYMKAVVAGMAQNKVIKAVKSGDMTEINKLRRLGFNDDTIREISSEMSHATKEGGLWVANTREWTSREAREVFEGALIKEADKVVLTPGVGDRPLWMNSEVGKTVGQFKTFIVASTNRMVIPLMQEDPNARKWVEIGTMMGLGVATYYASAALAGREPSYDPHTVTVEALDRTGLTAYGMEIMNIAEKVSGRNLMGKEEASTRFRSRSTVGALGGPTAGTVEELGKLAYYAARDDKTSAQRKASTDSLIHGVRRLSPLQNNVFLRRYLDHLEGEMAKSLGGTGKYGRKKDSSKPTDNPWK